MGRRVDQGLQKRRREVLDLLAIARLEVSAIADKCDELHTLAGGQLRGHDRGNQVILQARRAADVLHAAHGALNAASQAARGIDVTVEIPDEERR